MSTETAQERRRDQRTEVLLDGGFEAIRLERVTRRHKEVKWFADEALERFHARQHVSLDDSDELDLGDQNPNNQNPDNVNRNDDSPITTDPDEEPDADEFGANQDDSVDVSTEYLNSKILAELNRRLEKTHLAGLKELPLEHPQLVSFYHQLLYNPFAIDPNDYPKILSKAHTPEMQVEDSEDTPALPDQEAKEGKAHEKADAEQCYTHYVRVLRMTLVEAISLLDQWEHEYPIDWWHIQTKRLALANHTSDISWLYFGVSIAGDAASRDQDDWETVFRKTKGASTTAPSRPYGLSTRLYRFMSLLGDRRFEVYTIKPLCFKLVTDQLGAQTSVDKRSLMDGHPELWWGEKSLIAAGTTELLLNSNQGGSFIPFQSSSEVQKVVDQCLLDFPPSLNHLRSSNLKKDIAEHYRKARLIAKMEKQKPISLHALDAVIEGASLARRRPDGTTLFANVAKDITIRAAFSNGCSWYGKTAGRGPLVYRRAQAIARGDIFEFCDDGKLAQTSAFIVGSGWRLNHRVLRYEDQSLRLWPPCQLLGRLHLSRSLSRVSYNLLADNRYSETSCSDLSVGQGLGGSSSGEQYIGDVQTQIQGR